MNISAFQVIRRPIITEKVSGEGDAAYRGVEVAMAATKTQIKEAVQKIFKVKVAGVRTGIFHGKFRAAAARKATGATGRRRT